LAAFSVISQLLFVPESSRFCCKKAAQTMTAFCAPMWPWFVHKWRLHFVPGCGQVLCSNMATFCAQNAAVFCAPMQPCIVPKLGTKPSETRLKSGNGTEFTPHGLPMGLCKSRNSPEMSRLYWRDASQALPFLSAQIVKKCRPKSWPNQVIPRPGRIIHTLQDHYGPITSPETAQ
jgi:hypothetical protein